MIIAGKEVQFRFGMLAVEIFLSKSVKFESSTYSAFGLAHILHGGIVNYYEVKEQPIPVTYEQVYDHVENVLLTGEGADELNDLIKQFEASQPLKKKLEQINEVLKQTSNPTSDSLPTKQD